MLQHSQLLSSAYIIYDKMDRISLENATLCEVSLDWLQLDSLQQGTFNLGMTRWYS